MDLNHEIHLKTDSHHTCKLVLVDSFPDVARSMPYPNVSFRFASL